MPIRIILMIVWVAGMIFPVNWLSANNVEAKMVFTTVADTEFSHVIAHLLLYGGFVLWTVLLFRMRFSLRTGLILLVSIFVIAAGQEYLQLQVKGRQFGNPEIFDLQVDLAGGYLGWRLSYFIRWWGDQARRVWQFLRRQ